MVSFSIIIPTFNAEKRLPDAINSILEQTFSDFEILIIDGKSTDGTIHIIKDYAEKDKRVRFVSEKDNGIYDAMNKGITLASGEWLFFLGSDDKLFDHDVLQQVKKALTRSECDVIYGNVFSEHFNGLYDGEFTCEKLYRRNICHQSIFLNKAVFAQVGQFNTSYKSHADWDHNIKWFFHPDIKKVFVDITIAYYSAGGYSSVNRDYLFEYDKDFTFLNLGQKIINRQFKAGLYLSIAIKKKEQRHYFSFLSYKFKFWLARYA